MFYTSLGRFLREVPRWVIRNAAGSRTVTILRHRMALGDVLEISALVRGLKKADPAIRVGVATRRPEIFEHNPYVDENRGWHLWRTRYTVRAGYGGEDLNRVEHVVEVQWRALWKELAEAGWPVPAPGPPPLAGLHPEIFLTPDELNRARQQLGKPATGKAAKPVVLLSSTGKTVPVHNREWGVANFQAVADALAPHATILQVGGERPLLRDGKPLPSLSGRPVRETAALFAVCDALVTQEGGLGHLARAAGAAAVVIFGGSLLPQQTGYAESVNLWSKPECSPCFGTAVNCYHLKCMVPITPRRVVSAVGQLLAQRAGFALPLSAAEAAPDQWTPPEFVDRAILERELKKGGTT